MMHGQKNIKKVERCTVWVGWIISLGAES